MRITTHTQIKRNFRYLGTLEEAVASVGKLGALSFVNAIGFLLGLLGKLSTIVSVLLSHALLAFLHVQLKISNNSSHIIYMNTCKPTVAAVAAVADAVVDTR